MIGGSVGTAVLEQCAQAIVNTGQYEPRRKLSGLNGRGLPASIAPRPGSLDRNAAAPRGGPPKPSIVLMLGGARDTFGIFSETVSGQNNRRPFGSGEITGSWGAASGRSDGRGVRI